MPVRDYDAPRTAVIFDVDGVLLQLTDAEAELFFVPFNTYLDATALSRDWNTYRIRNDEDIVEEILERHNLSLSLKLPLIADYLNLLNQSINSQSLDTIPVSGALHLLRQLHGHHRLGVATANFREAARMRLESAGFWTFVSKFAFGADGGGHKRDILARAIAALGLPPDRIVYVGDNRNDVEAGLAHGVHFIGFSQDLHRRAELQEYGARHIASHHSETADLIAMLLAA
jgi:phosphoglycolate phosphatase-like HAD superfamily hydrolase